MRVKIYCASKLNHAQMWRDLAQDWCDIIEIVARWPFSHVDNIPDTECFAKLFWQQDQEDVAKADAVLIYAEPKDKLRGALVEAGMGIVYNIPVIVVGSHSDYSTWQYHPNVHRVPDMDAAKLLLTCMGIQ